MIKYTRFRSDIMLHCSEYKMGTIMKKGSRTHAMTDNFANQFEFCQKSTTDVNLKVTYFSLIGISVN
jgi:ribonuclease HIII